MDCSGASNYMEHYRLAELHTTHKRPSFLIFGMDGRQPMEAASLSLTPIDTTVAINDYRELIKVLSVMYGM